MDKQGYFDNINYIRILLILLLVAYHSFAPYSGAWESIYADFISGYKWFAETCYSAMLELFVFISGYLFGYKLYKVKVLKEGHISFISLLKSKAIRLLVPTYIYGILYVVVFGSADSSFMEISYSIVNGVGHLWFLPMIFACFPLTYLIDKINIKYPIILALAYLFAILPTLPLPFRLGSMIYYFPFFYLGFILTRFNLNISQSYKKSVCLLLILLYALSFWGLSTWVEGLENSSVLLEKLIYLFERNSARAIYATLGVGAIFLTIGLLIDKGILKSNYKIRLLGEYSFGVYIYQQFILRYLYYNTDIPQKYLDAYSLPFVGFFFALFLSLLIVHLLRKTKVGRKLC